MERGSTSALRGPAHHATLNMVRRPAAPLQGTHMSRFVEISRPGARDHGRTFQQMVREMVEKLEAEEGQVEMTFPYFIERRRRVSGVKSLLDYEVTSSAASARSRAVLQHEGGVPVTSLCPCSKKISERGAPQPALARHDHRTDQRVRLDRGAGRPRREAGLVRALRPAESAPTRSTSPSAPTTTRSSSRTWCATSPQCSTSTSASSATWSSRRNFESIHNQAPTRESRKTKRER